MGSQFVEAVNQMSGCHCFMQGQNVYAVYIYIPSMYKSLKVKYVHKHTTLGFDKKSRYKVSITIADSSCKAWQCCQTQTRQWINPFLITPEEDVICGHHVLGYGQWYYILG